MPVRIPISVIPICTVEKNLSGFSAKASASFADLLPFFASRARFDFLSETSAISDIARIPFDMISAAIMTNSIFCRLIIIPRIFQSTTKKAR